MASPPTQYPFPPHGRNVILGARGQRLLGAAAVMLLIVAWTLAALAG